MESWFTWRERRQQLLDWAKGRRSSSASSRTQVHLPSQSSRITSKMMMNSVRSTRSSVEPSCKAVRRSLRFKTSCSKYLIYSKSSCLSAPMLVVLPSSLTSLRFRLWWQSIVKANLQHRYSSYQVRSSHLLLQTVWNEIIQRLSSRNTHTSFCIDSTHAFILLLVKLWAYSRNLLLTYSLEVQNSEFAS